MSIRHLLHILLLAFAVCGQEFALAAHQEYADAGTNDDTDCIECALFQASSAGAIDHPRVVGLQPAAPMLAQGLYLQAIRNCFTFTHSRAPPT